MNTSYCYLIVMKKTNIKLFLNIRLINSNYEYCQMQKGTLWRKMPDSLETTNYKLLTDYTSSITISVTMYTSGYIRILHCLVKTCVVTRRHQNALKAINNQQNITLTCTKTMVACDKRTFLYGIHLTKIDKFTPQWTMEEVSENQWRWTKSIHCSMYYVHLFIVSTQNSSTFLSNKKSI